MSECYLFPHHNRKKAQLARCPILNRNIWPLCTAFKSCVVWSFAVADCFVSLGAEKTPESSRQTYYRKVSLALRLSSAVSCQISLPIVWSMQPVCVLLSLNAENNANKSRGADQKTKTKALRWSVCFVDSVLQAAAFRSRVIWSIVGLGRVALHDSQCI